MIEPGRPNLPPGYGLKPPTEGRLIRWSYVVAKLAASRNYWIATASPQGVPHVAPVWGIWHREAFYFLPIPSLGRPSTLPGTTLSSFISKAGTTLSFSKALPTSYQRATFHSELDAAYFHKYGFHLRGNPTYRIEPRRAFAWSEADFPESATRWQFPDPDAPADA